MNYQHNVTHDVTAADYTEAVPNIETITEMQTTATEESESFMDLLRELVETFLLALILFFIVNTLTSRYEVQSISMEPTLHEGQYLIVSKVSYWFHSPERGDIVVLQPPEGSGSIPYIKRVIGLPGEEVEIYDKRVWVDGTALDEPYINEPPTYTKNWEELKDDEYVVLGDNRNNSSDSHAWGTLDRDEVLGKAVFRYWPLDKWGTFPHYGYQELEATQ